MDVVSGGVARLSQHNKKRSNTLHQEGTHLTMKRCCELYSLVCCLSNPSCTQINREEGANTRVISKTLDEAIVTTRLDKPFG
jgi:hypothetical protein